MSPNFGITNTLAKRLEGATWKIDNDTFQFASRRSDSRGELPWHAGAEGLAYPLLNELGETAHFAKFFKPSMASGKRIDRTRWLIDQAVFAWAPELRAAPRRILDTRVEGRPDGIDFDFCCVLSEAVAGRSWLDAKGEIMDGTWSPTVNQRVRWVEQLARGLAILEQHGICHGDVSPYNVIVTRNEQAWESSLSLIDFDGFLAPSAGELRCLHETDGGTIGTEGYFPAGLEALRKAGRSGAESKSDRYARDMLMLEMVVYDGSWEFDEPVSRYNEGHVKTLIRNANLPPCLRHLARGDIFSVRDDQRVGSCELAQRLGIAMPPRRKQHRHGQAGAGVQPRWGTTLVPAISFGLWIIVSWSFVRLIIPVSASGMGYLAQCLVHVFLFLVTLAAGAAFLAYEFMCRESPQVLEVGGMRVLLPSRRKRVFSLRAVVPVMAVIGALIIVIALLGRA